MHTLKIDITDTKQMSKNSKESNTSIVVSDVQMDASTEGIVDCM